MELGPAHSFGEGLSRTAILLFLVVGFFATFAISFWLGDKWFGPFSAGNRMIGLPLALCWSIYTLVVLVLVQFW